MNNLLNLLLTFPFIIIGAGIIYKQNCKNNNDLFLVHNVLFFLYFMLQILVSIIYSNIEFLLIELIILLIIINLYIFIISYLSNFMKANFFNILNIKMISLSILFIISLMIFVIKYYIFINYTNFSIEGDNFQIPYVLSVFNVLSQNFEVAFLIIFCINFIKSPSIIKLIYCTFSFIPFLFPGLVAMGTKRALVFSMVFLVLYFKKFLFEHKIYLFYLISIFIFLLLRYQSIRIGINDPLIVPLLISPSFIENILGVILLIFYTTDLQLVTYRPSVADHFYTLLKYCMENGVLLLGEITLNSVGWILPAFLTDKSLLKSSDDLIYHYFNLPINSVFINSNGVDYATSIISELFVDFSYFSILLGPLLVAITIHFSYILYSKLHRAPVIKFIALALIFRSLNLIEESLATLFDVFRLSLIIYIFYETQLIFKRYLKSRT